MRSGAQINMSLRLTTTHENVRSALECGSLLPLSLSPACWPCSGAPPLWSEAASKPAGLKRQQAAALQSFTLTESNYVA
jgi:hypothetical protein